MEARGSGLPKATSEVRFELVSQCIALCYTSSPKHRATPQGPPTKPRCKIMSRRTTVILKGSVNGLPQFRSPKTGCCLCHKLNEVAFSKPLCLSCSTANTPYLSWLLHGKLHELKYEALCPLRTCDPSWMQFKVFPKEILETEGLGRQVGKHCLGAVALQQQQADHTKTGQGFHLMLFSVTGQRTKVISKEKSGCASSAKHYSLPGQGQLLVAWPEVTLWKTSQGTYFASQDPHPHPK